MKHENNNNNNTLRDRIHSLRLDLRRLEVGDGLVPHLLLGWWLPPVKFLGDVVLRVVAKGVAPVLLPSSSTSSSSSTIIVPLLEWGLQCTQTVAHGVYGWTSFIGLVRSSLSSYETVLGLSRLQALGEQTDAFKERVVKMVHAEAGKQMFLLGVNQSVWQSVTSPYRDELLALMHEGYTALLDYAKDQDILREAEEMGGLRYIENKALLGVMQQAALDRRHQKRHEEMLMDNQAVVKAAILKKFPMEEAAYFMKFATAAYGDNGIRSAQIDGNNEQHVVFDCRRGDMTLQRVCEHTGILDAADFCVFDVHYDRDVQHLRHFVALDHGRKTIVLAIRGTYTYREVMIDFNGYSFDFLGSEAHAAMALFAERLWDKTSAKVIETMDQYPDYELIVCGHSLGGGTTCLLNLLLHADPRMEGRKWRAFAYASPPVYVQLPSSSKGVSEQAATCVNYINQFDGVPFLSGDTVRHQMAMIAAVDKAGLSFIQRANILLGIDKVDDELVEKIHDIQRTPLPVTKKGCPRHMTVPALGNVWMVPDEEEEGESYKVVIADSIKMSETGIFVHKEDLADHLPARYEYVLQRVHSG